MLDVERVRAALARVLPDVRADLERLVRIPSVSADPAAAASMRASADLVAEQMRSAGVTEVEVLQVEGGQPAVLGHRPGPAGSPTVLLWRRSGRRGCRRSWPRTANGWRPMSSCWPTR